MGSIAARRVRCGAVLLVFAAAGTTLSWATASRAAANANVVPSPNQTAFVNRLHGIDGSDPARVWAVGVATDGNRFMPRSGSILMRWDGSAWSLVDHPRPSGSSGLNDVDAISASDAWAVGASNPAPGQPGRTLTLHWDGAAWRIVPSPNPDGSNNLEAVEAAASDDVWAVGSHQSSRPGLGGFDRLVLRWDGRQWRTVSTPASMAGFRLLAVDATSAINAWAVGIRSNPLTGATTSKAMRWNGTAWQEVPIPDPDNMVLGGVATLGPNDVWAVGTALGGGGAKPVTLHWDGSAWTRVDTPVDRGDLTDVVAASSSRIVAVGAATSNGVQRPLILQWNGSAWTEVPASTGTVDPILRGVATIGPGTVWAAGSHQVGPRVPDPGFPKTLTIRVDR